MSDIPMLIAIDPGPRESAWVRMEADIPLQFAIEPNEEVLAKLRHQRFPHGAHLAIEMVASYGMAVGKDVFNTCVWIGRFIQAWGGPHTLVYRQDVKLTICHDSRARDSNIRQAIIDRYPPTGGGKVPQIGTKAKPGPLYGVTKDVWSALAVALTWQEMKKEARNAQGRTNHDLAAS